MQSYKTDRIVFDTNIYISFILQNRLDKLVLLIEKHQLEVFICDELLRELKSTLNKPYISTKLSAKKSDYLEVVALITEHVIIDKCYDKIIDPDDNYLIDLAYSTKSYYLVSEDKVLLNHKQVNKIKIISMLAFKKLLKNNG